MGKYFLDKTEEGIRLVFMQFDKRKIKEGVSLLQEAVEEGDPDAYGFLGRAFMGRPFIWEHSGIETDEEIGRMYIRESARKGSACGALTALECKELTEEVRQAMPYASWEEAFGQVLEHAKEGHVTSQYILGSFLSIDPKNGQEAVVWLEKALYQGCSLALYPLYRIYTHEEGNHHQEELLKAIRFGAEQGDPVWQRKLGTICYQRMELEKALLWYAKAAAFGEYPAWHDLGCMYEWGEGTPQDYEMAATAYEKGAKAGDALAQGRYGKLLFWGHGVPKDEVKAYYWFSQSYEQDNQNPVIQVYMGHFLLYGTFSDPYPSRGIALLMEALDYQTSQGKRHPGLDKDTLGLLLLDLGDACEEGLGIKQNFEQAAGYYKLLADEGSQKGKERLSRYKKPLFGRWKKKV